GNAGMESWRPLQFTRYERLRRARLRPRGRLDGPASADAETGASSLDAVCLGRRRRRPIDQGTDRPGATRPDLDRVFAARSRLADLAPPEPGHRGVADAGHRNTLVCARFRTQPRISELLLHSRALAAIHLDRPPPRRSDLVLRARSARRVLALDRACMAHGHNCPSRARLRGLAARASPRGLGDDDLHLLQLFGLQASWLRPSRFSRPCRAR